MKFDKITIENYKSLGDISNTIKMTADIIALVGKNGSGKTNILTALGELQFFNKSSSVIFDSVNRYRNKPVKIEFTVEFSTEETRVAGIDASACKIEDKIIHFSFEKHHSAVRMNFDGFFSHAIKENSEIVQKAKILAEHFSAVEQSKTGEAKQWLQNIIYFLNHIDTSYYSLNYQYFADNFFGNSADKKEIFSHFQKQLSSVYAKFRNISPKIFLATDEELKDSYTLEELKKDGFIDKSKVLSQYFSAIGISSAEFLAVMEENNESLRASALKKINKRNKDLSEKFNKFYSTERVDFELSCQDKRYVFTISTNDSDQVFRFSERSNGLRWYFNFFIALQAAGIDERALILLDEPAVHLHINAQKEILRLFVNFSRQGNQIIYTTHSPAMIDVDSLEQVRTVQKEDNISRIQMIHSSVNGQSCLETISPITQAMGCCLMNDLAPHAQKCNLIVEGIIDYYYLKAMLHFLDIPENTRPYILPACGVDNTPHLVSILLGWGYHFKVLLDNDREGHNAYRQINKILSEDTPQLVFYIRDEVGCTVESLVKHEKNHSENKESKTIIAKYFMDTVLKGVHIPEEDSINNFKDLFFRLGVTKDK